LRVDRGGPADRGGRARAHRGPAERDRRGYRHRADRGAVLHRRRAPAQGACPVSTIANPETTPPAAGPAATRDAVDVVARGRRRRGRRRNVVVAVLAALLVATFAVTLMVGQTFYGPGEVTSVILGEQVSGASFTVGRLRLPRATLGVLTGLCFGLGGV